MSERKIWIGSLAAYNSGVLLGAWFDADDAPTEAAEWVQEMARLDIAFRALRNVDDTEKAAVLEEYARMHEELWVFDHEGFGEWLTGECSPDEAVRIAELVGEIESDGHDPDVVALWAAHEGRGVTEWDKPTREDFEEAYVGEFASEEEYAEELANDLGVFDNVNDSFRAYFDFEAFARDLFMSDMYSERNPDGGIYVFRAF